MVKKLFIFSFIWLLLAFQLYAADIYDETVNVFETESCLIYFGSTYYAAARGTGDSLTNHYTQWFEIADCNDNNGFIYLQPTNVAGTEDVNILPWYGFDADTGIVSSLNSGVVVDQLAATYIGDTLNVYNGATCIYFSQARWMRLQFDGQTGNTNHYVYWWVVLQKDNMDANYKHRKNIRDHKASMGWYGLIFALFALGSGITYYIKRKRE